MSLPSQPLHVECRALTRYLVDADPTGDIETRYAQACLALWPDEPPAAELLWLRRHPSSTRWLDAATALISRQSPLRKRIVLMAAILEATTTHAEFFLAPAPGPFELILLTLWRGKLAVLKGLIGVPLLWWARSVD